MHALQIKRNGEILAVVGAADALMLAADITASINEPGAVIDARGMNDLGNDRHSHTTWIEQSPLSRGDRLEVCFLETECATLPNEEVATDSEEYKAGQAEYAAQVDSEPLVPRMLETVQQDATIRLQVEGQGKIVATLEGGREFIACRLLWNRWRPERCRVSLSSFSQSEAIARAGSREWFSGALVLGESCAIEVGA